MFSFIYPPQYRFQGRHLKLGYNGRVHNCQFDASGSSMQESNVYYVIGRLFFMFVNTTHNLDFCYSVIAKHKHLASLLAQYLIVTQVL